MTKTLAPDKLSSPVAPAAKTKKVVGDKNAATKLFMGAVIDMSWQLAIVVLVPIIGGFELDKALKTSPVLVIVGFVLAMFGTYAVLRRTLKEYSAKTVPALPKETK